MTTWESSAQPCGSSPDEASRATIQYRAACGDAPGIRCRHSHDGLVLPLAVERHRPPG